MNSYIFQYPLLAVGEELSLHEAVDRVNFICSLVKSNISKKEKILLVDEALKISFSSPLQEYPMYMNAVRSKIDEFSFDTDKSARHLNVKWQKFKRDGKVRNWVGLDEEKVDEKDGEWKAF